MKTQRTWPYLSLVALMGLAGCSTSRQTAQNTGEMDDLYASSSNAVVYEGNSQSAQRTERAETSRVTTRQREREQYQRNTNPDYVDNDEQRGYNQNQDEYYTELSTRNIKRGLSADPGWNAGSYGDGFTDGYYAGLGNPAFNSSRWNSWGWNGGFNTGLSIGLGLGSAWGNPWGWNSWNRWGGGVYDPFWGGGFNSFAYNPWGVGWNSWGYSPWGFNNFYNPYWGGGFNRWSYGGGWGYPVIVNNVVTGADPYRSNRTVGARGGTSSNRYNDSFNNTPRNYDPNRPGGRTAGSSSPVYSGNTGAANTGSSDGYYARPRNNSRGTYYYENGGSGTGARTTNEPTRTYSDNSGNSSNGGYYSAPRQNSRGSYSAPSDGGSRGGYTQSQPSYQAPQRTYESRPSYQQSQPSQPSYSAPSYGGSRGGGSYSSGGSSSGGSSSGGGGGGSRGPR